MDRTSRIAVFACGFALFALWVFTEPPPPKPNAHPPVSAQVAPATLPPTATTAENALAPAPKAPIVETLSTLENEAIKVTLTSKGAAIKTIELKKEKEGSGNVVLNEKSRTNVLELGGWPGADTVNFQLKPSDSTSGTLIYTADLPGGVKWQRSYSFGQAPGKDNGFSGGIRVLFNKLARHLGESVSVPLVYTLDVKDTLINSGATDIVLPSYSLSIGRALPLLVHGHYQAISNQYVGAGWLANKFNLTTINNFEPGFIPFIGYKTAEGKDLISSTSIDPTPLRWVGVENQFYTLLLTPNEDRSIQHAIFQCYNQRDADGKTISKYDSEGYLEQECEPDIEAAAFFPEIKIPAGQTVSVGYGLYAGPKDYNRLDALGADQGELMNYDGIIPFSLFIVPMLTILHFWYLIFQNYGIAIILLTLMIKAITWPLQSIANRSGKRMQALALLPEMQKVKEKFKDQPEKLQMEIWAMNKEYGVNPFGGCLPAFVQMPVFFSLYFMLMNAVELRGQSFLWVHDLTQPDTVASIPLPFALPLIGAHIPINPLPIIVTALMMVMMRMTPQIGDPQQAKIAQWMPLIFLFMFYNFAAGLSLYYVINNFVSIIQIYRNLRKPMPVLKRIPVKKTA